MAMDVGILKKSFNLTQILFKDEFSFKAIYVSEMVPLSP